MLTHADPGLQYVIISPEYPFDFRAVIDWEFNSCQPFLAAVPGLIEPLFWKQERASSKKWEGEDELRAAFWEIPEWAEQKDSVQGREFMEWYRFGLYLKPNPLLRLDALP